MEQLGGNSNHSPGDNFSISTNSNYNIYNDNVSAFTYFAGGGNRPIHYNMPYVSIDLSSADVNPCGPLNCKNGWPAGIRQMRVENNIIGVYPNPATDYLMFDFSAINRWEGGELLINNILGNTVYHDYLTAEASNRINTHQLTPGMYFYTIVTNGHILTGNFIIVH